MAEKEEGRPTEETANPNTNTDQNHPTGSPNSTGSSEVGEGGETRWENLPLDPQHVDKLKSSGISPLTAGLRGYETVYDPRRLADLGFAKALCGFRHVPGLLIPLLRKDGSTWGYQYRPDSPRADARGKPVKYDTPVRQSNGLDIPPWYAGGIDDPKVEKFITEGSLKADALAEQGICAIALSGVWNWKGRNPLGGKTALPDWHEVAIEGSHFVIAYDSDVMAKSSVRAALVEIANFLHFRKAGRIRYVHLPDGPNGEKWGVDDYLAAGHTREDLYRLVKPDIPIAWSYEDAMGQSREDTPQDRQAEPPKPPPPYGSIDGAADIRRVSIDASHTEVLPAARAVAGDTAVEVIDERIGVITDKVIEQINEKDPKLFVRWQDPRFLAALNGGHHRGYYYHHHHHHYYNQMGPTSPMGPGQQSPTTTAPSTPRP